MCTQTQIASYIFIILLVHSHLTLEAMSYKERRLDPLHEKIEYTAVTFKDTPHHYTQLNNDIRRNLKKSSSLLTTSSTSRGKGRELHQDYDKQHLHESHHSLHRHLHDFKLITERPPSLPLPPLDCGWGKKLEKPSSHRIIDIFMFNGEFDIVEARFYELNSTVDIFIVSEDEITFTGDPKIQTFPFLVEERLQLFKHKIIYLDGKVNPNKQGSTSHNDRDAAFRVERGKRNSLVHFVPGGVQPTDYITMCDADELVSEHWFRVLRYCDFGGKNVGFKAATSHYSLHHVAEIHQFGVTGCIGSFLIQGNPLQLCHKANSRPTYITANPNNNWKLHHGWHMSYFGSPLWIQQKLNSYAETKTNSAPYNNLNYIKDHAYKGLDLLEQSCYNWTYITREKVNGPWFYLANQRHRASFHRYHNPLKDSGDTHCLVLDDTYGSLGEQLFSIFSVFSRAYRLGIQYVLPFEKNSQNRQSYWNSEFLRKMVVESYSVRDCSPFQQVLAIDDKFRGIPDFVTAKEKSFSISGYMFNKTDLRGEGLKNILHNRLINPTSQIWRRKHTGRLLAIGAESHLDSKTIPAWGNPSSKSTTEYYERAIKTLDLSKYDGGIHIFGDSSKTGAIESLVAKYARGARVFTWKESVESAPIHLGYMSQCDDFVIGAGLVHFWGAFLSISPNKLVVYPSDFAFGHSFIPHVWEKV